MPTSRLPTANKSPSLDNDTAEIEQEIAKVRPYFDALNEFGVKWAKADPHAIVDLPNRLKGPLADDPILAMSALLLRIQQDENMPFIGVHYMKAQATALYNLEATDCIRRLIDQEEQGQEDRLRKALNILRHLDQWLDDVTPYFEQFEARRREGFKHAEMIRHYFPLDQWDQSFAIFQAIGALRDSIVEAANPGIDPVPTDTSTVSEEGGTEPRFQAVVPSDLNKQDFQVAVLPIIIAITPHVARYAIMRFGPKITLLAKKAISAAATSTLVNIEFTNEMGDLYLNLKPGIAFRAFKIQVGANVGYRMKLYSGGSNTQPPPCKDDVCRKIDEFLEQNEYFQQNMADWQEFMIDKVDGISHELEQLKGLFVEYIKGEVDREQYAALIRKHQQGIQAMHSSMQALSMFGGLINSPELVKAGMFGQHAIEIAAALSSLGVIKATAFAPVAALGPYVGIILAGLSIITMFTSGGSSSAMKVISQQLNHITDLLYDIAENQAIIVENQRKIYEYLTLIGNGLVAGFRGLQEYIGKEFELTRYHNQLNHDEIMSMLNKIYGRLLDRTMTLYLAITEYKKAIHYVRHYSHYYPVPNEVNQQRLKDSMLSLVYVASDVVFESILTAADETQGEDPFSYETILQVLKRINKVGYSWVLGYLKDYYKSKISQDVESTTAVCNVELWKQVVIALEQGFPHLPAEQLPSEQVIANLYHCGEQAQSVIRQLQHDGLRIFNRFHAGLRANNQGIALIFEQLKKNELTKLVNQYREKIKRLIDVMRSLKPGIPSKFATAHNETFLLLVPMDEFNATALTYVRKYAEHIRNSITQLEILHQYPKLGLAPLVAPVLESTWPLPPRPAGHILLKPFVIPVLGRIPNTFFIASYLCLGHFTGTVRVQKRSLPRGGINRAYSVDLIYVDVHGTSHLLATAEYQMISLPNFPFPAPIIPHYPWNEGSVSTKLTNVPFSISPDGDLVQATQAQISGKVSSLAAAVDGQTMQFKILMDKSAATLAMVEVFANVIGMPTNYTQKVSEYLKRPPTEQISIQFIQDSIINQLYDRLPDYDLVEKLDEAVAFISDSAEDFYHSVVPNVTEVELTQWSNEVGYKPFDVIPAFNGSEPVWPTFNSSLMKHILSGFSVLKMTKTTRHIMYVQHNVDSPPREIILTPKPTTTVEPVLTQDQQTGLSTGAAISIGLATGIFATAMLMFGCVRLANRRAPLPLKMLALLGLGLKKHEDYISLATRLPGGESLSYEQERWFERHENVVHEQINTTPPANDSQSVSAERHHAMVPYQARTRRTAADKTDYQVMLQCYFAQHSDGVPYLHCLADELQVLVFASDKRASPQMVQDRQAAPGGFDFLAARSTCQRVNLYNEPFMHCEGTSPEANYFVRLNGPTIPTFVEFCDHLPSSLQMINFFVAVYQRYWGESSQEEMMDAQPQNSSFASWQKVDDFHKKVSGELTECATLKTGQHQRFVLQEYLETINDWRRSQPPTVAELTEYEEVFKEICQEIASLQSEFADVVRADESNKATSKQEGASNQIQRGMFSVVYSLFRQSAVPATNQHPDICALPDFRNSAMMK